jgi:prepilin-type N-terminal cleavage/methylation domain-containing protein
VDIANKSCGGLAVNGQRKGFTMVEMLVVITVLVILIGLFIAGITVMGSQGREQLTSGTFESLNSMVAAYEQTTRGRTGFPTGALDAPAEMIEDLGQADSPPGIVQYRRYGTAVARTETVMRRLLSLPENQRIMENIPAERQMRLTTSADAPPLLLDGWGNPIIFVPPEGLRFLNRIENSELFTVTNPSGRFFWASAGPDGKFQAWPEPGDTSQRHVEKIQAAASDNLYSFDH